MDHWRGGRETGRRNTAKRWTAEEDATLRELVMGSGIEVLFISVWSQFLLTVANVGEEAINWVDVAGHLSGRTNKDSRRRWTKIKDNFNRGIWSRDEDESLRVAVERFGQRWALVTEVVETRSPDREQTSNSVSAAHMLTARRRMSKTLAQCVGSENQRHCVVVI
jgi:hypothetical protein